MLESRGEGGGGGGGYDAGPTDYGNPQPAMGGGTGGGGGMSDDLDDEIPF